MVTETGNIKSYHIKFTNESSKWAIPSSKLILGLMMSEPCLIYFYSQQHKITFHSFLGRSVHKDSGEKKQIERNVWVFCNKNDPKAMEAMSHLPKLSKHVHLAPSVTELIETGTVEVHAIEDACTICKRYYKTAFFKDNGKPLLMLSEKKGYVIKIVDFNELALENQQATLIG